MKTITDFKNRMQPGAMVTSRLYWKLKEGGEVQQNEIKNRECKVSATGSFALSVPGMEKPSWCHWPKKDEFTVLDEDTVQIEWATGRLVYQFEQRPLQTINEEGGKGSYILT